MGKGLRSAVRPGEILGGSLIGFLSGCSAVVSSCGPPQELRVLVIDIFIFRTIGITRLHFWLVAA